MKIYDVDKLVTEARRLAVEYRAATGKTLPITAEIAVNDAIRHLRLTPAGKDESGYDATMDRHGETLRVQIKGRVIFDESRSGYRLGQLKVEQNWDAIILVTMNAAFEPMEMYLARREDLLDVLAQSKSRKGSMTVARFRNLGALIWTAANGPEDDGYWSNVSA